MLPSFFSRYLALKWLTCFVVLAYSVTVRAAPQVSPESPAPAGSASPESAAPAKDELPSRRYEFLPVPDFGGNSDVGLEAGVVFTLVRFYDDAKPYKWLFGGIVSTSFKDDSRGFRMVQQYHAFRIDIPGLFGGRVRIDTRANYGRNVIARWVGVGNASSSAGFPIDGGEYVRRDQYIAQQLRLRSVVRVKTGTPFDLAFSANLHYEYPDTYLGSRLAYDAAHGLPGTEEALITSLGTGVMLDTRDSEFVPHQGVFYQLGVLGAVGSAERVAFGEASAVLQQYVPLGSKMTFATRLMASFLFGRAPFYELPSGGVFNPVHMVGGERGLRGVPEARYAGHVKMLGNAELRTTFIPPFRVLRWMLQVGTTTFFDAGRVWNDYDSSAFDGNAPGIKYSVGGGFFFQWDRSSVFRVEVAYSPTDHGHADFPLAYYLANGLIF